MLDPAIKKQFRELEQALQERTDEVVALRAQLEGNGQATEEIIRAGMVLREEEVADLAHYQAAVKVYVPFIEEVAQSKSKFGKRAREILGI